MLDKLATIKLRKLSSVNFNKPDRDTKTGDILKDNDDAPIMFVPKSCRARCPIKLSNKFKDNMQIQNLLYSKQNAITKNGSKKWQSTTKKKLSWKSL